MTGPLRFPMTLDASPVRDWMASDAAAPGTVRLENGRILTLDEFGEYQRAGRAGGAAAQARYLASLKVP